MNTAEIPPHNLFARAVLQAYIDAHPIAEEHVRREYERRKKVLARRTQYGVQHVVVAKLAEALSIVRKLARGAELGLLARERCRDLQEDPGERALEWISLATTEPVLIEAVANLPIGGFTAEPVYTPCGWHVLQLHAIRKVTLMPFDAMKQSLRHSLETARLNMLMRELQSRGDAR